MLGQDDHDDESYLAISHEMVSENEQKNKSSISQIFP